MAKRNDARIIRLPGRPKTWNSFAHASKWTYIKYRKQVARMVFYCVKAQHVRAIEGPVCIQFVYGYSTKRRSDITDVCTKPHVDALVENNIISDDNRFVVHAISHTWREADEEYTDIRITAL